MVAIVLFIGSVIFDFFHDIYKIVGWWTLLVSPLALVALFVVIGGLFHLASWVFDND